MKFLDLDSPLMQILSKVADLLWLNILTLICCIPIITIGASLTALHSVALKMVRNEDSYIARSFFKSFKENFRQSTLIWLLLLLVIAVIAGDFYIINNSGVEFHVAIQVIISAVGLLVLFTALYVFAVQAKFKNTIIRTIRNSFLISILQLPKTVLMVILGILPIILIFISERLLPISFLFGISAPVYFSAMLYNKFFKRLEVQATEAARERGELPEEPGSEDEGIFKDMPEEESEAGSKKKERKSKY